MLNSEYWIPINQRVEVGANTKITKATRNPDETVQNSKFRTKISLDPHFCDENFGNLHYVSRAHTCPIIF